MAQIAEQIIHRVHLEKLIEETKGQFFAVRFKKVDDSDRLMNCRVGVHIDLKGGACRAQRPDTSYKVVWSLGDKAYRLINLNTIYEFHWKKQVYHVIKGEDS